MKNRGFSLVELSVVLVIIGLLISGVLIGKSMVKTAKKQSIVADWQKYSTAANSYFSKYNYWPGDDCDRSNKWGGLTNSPTCGNGTLEDPVYVGANEYFYFWQDLSLGSFITGTFQGNATNVPTTQISQSWMSHFYDTANPTNQAFYLSGNAGPSETDNSAYVLTDADAASIDTQIDDGASNTGFVRAVGGSCDYTQTVDIAYCNLYYTYKK